MKKFKTSVIIVMLGTLLSKALGLIREVFLAQKYGTGIISDAYIISLNISNVIISAIATAILTNYIPIYSKVEKKSSEEAKKFNGNLISTSFLFSTILVILFLIFTKPIVKLFAIGFDDAGINCLANLSRITIFSVYFIILSHVLKGFLEYKNKFLGTSLYGILMNVGMILGIVFSSTKNYQILGYGVLLGYVLSAIVLIVLALKNKFSIKPNINFNDKNIKKIVILTLPLLLNDVVWQLNGIIDKSISSSLGSGYISAINYSHYIVDIIISIFATSIVTVFFPKIVKLFNDDGIKVVKEKTNVILKLIVFTSLPCTVLISAYSKTIIKILFFRGAFDEISLKITSVAVSIYAFAIVFASLKTILFKVFYALEDTKSPTKSAVIAIIFNIIFSLILIKPMGYIGIVLATVVSSIISTILLILFFNKNHESLLEKSFWINSIKILFGSIIMFVVIYITNKYTINIYLYNNLLSDILRMIIGAMVGGVVYIISLFLMKFDFKLNLH